MRPQKVKLLYKHETGLVWTFITNKSGKYLYILMPLHQKHILQFYYHCIDSLCDDDSINTYGNDSSET